MSFEIIKKRIKMRDVFEGDIVDVSYGWKSMCPFHSENEPSFKVTESESGDLWYCHGCKRGGDIFKFIEEYKFLNKRDTYMYLAKLAGLDDDEYKYPKDKFMQLISGTNRNHKFFIDKKISKKSLDVYGVGYIDDINNFNIDGGFASKWNLLSVKDVIFYPMRDRSGYTIGYYLRNMHNSPKYFGNSDLHIFGLNALGKGQQNIILFEGFNDVIKAYDKGMRNVLGVCGTNFNEKMFKIMSEHGIRHVIIVPDTDFGGDEYISTIIQKYGTFDMHGVSVGYAVMDQRNIDPDEYIDINEDFFVNIGNYEINPIKKYYMSLSGFNWVRVSEILRSKPYIPLYEIQLSLKDVFGGIIDIRNANKSLNDILSEEILIGNMLRDSMLRLKMISTFDERYFTVPEYKRIFNFIKDNQSVSIDTIKNTFGIEMNKSDIYGNDIYLDKLKKMYDRREICKIISKYNSDVYLSNISTDVLIQNVVNDLSSFIKIDDNVVTIDNVVLSTIDDINSDLFDGMSISDRFPQTNNLIRGLMKGKLFVIAGNSGHGKTSLVCNIVNSISLVGKYKTLFFTDEMSANEIMLRMFSIYTGKSYNGIIDRKEKIDENICKDLMHKRLIFSNLPSIEDLYSKSKMLYMKYGGVDLMTFDYVQLIHGDSGYKQRYQELSLITKILKKISRDLNINVIAVSQLNKDNLKSDVSKIENLSGGYDMLADADVGVTIKKNNVQNSVTQGNAQLNLDKVRYNHDDILIPIYYDVSNLRMSEVNVIK